MTQNLDPYSFHHDIRIIVVLEMKPYLVDLNKTMILMSHDNECSYLHIYIDYLYRNDRKVIYNT